MLFFDSSLFGKFGHSILTAFSTRWGTLCNVVSNLFFAPSRSVMELTPPKRSNLALRTDAAEVELERLFPPRATPCFFGGSVIVARVDDPFSPTLLLLLPHEYFGWGRCSDCCFKMNTRQVRVRVSVGDRVRD